ncbi:MAG: tRNA (adenosine(37)-N6)-threonylcarbamoyltransferase complex transferase subunit TsaD, partial [Alphaproteobacteria bacterium]|nr:tRNA (adenosine(37)-N6)-threonylcarbamoyltransferase complex transferase subunit TsaD [Alphaproteobacteria bacterium]
VAKMLDLGYPGGPKVEDAAGAGNPLRFPLPRPLFGDGTCDLSLSGLKTAVLRALQSLPSSPTRQDIADLCASFQLAVTDVLKHKTETALERYLARWKEGALVIAGGVAANKSVRATLENVAHKHGLRFAVAPAALCTDNAAMIAWAGVERLKLGWSDALDAAPKARWPLDLGGA